MARLARFGVAHNALALVVLVVPVGAGVLACVRPGGFGADATQGSMDPGSVPPRPAATDSNAIATRAPVSDATESPSARATPTPMTDAAVIEFKNPDGPDPADYPVDGYPFIETAYALPTYGQLWIDNNQRDVHIALTGDIEAAIEVLRDGVPRGITVYFHIVEHTQAELCALRDAMFDDRDELMRRGIVLTSGGCASATPRVVVGMSPLTPEAIAYMRAHYDGPIDYEPGGTPALRPYDPPEVDDVRLIALRASDDLGLLTCGRRPFPAAAVNSAPTDINATGGEYGALREALSIYVDVYGDLSGLGWILAEKDDYGATFMADRGDTWLEAPVFAGRTGWVPGTIDYCLPRPLTLDDGGTASVYIDGAFPKLAADATEIHVLVEELSCSGGSSPASRLLPPGVRYEDDTVTLIVRVRGVGGPATCQGNPSLPVTIQLPEPLGDRELRGVTAAPRY